MILIGQSIPYGNPGISCQFFHDLLSVSAIFYPVKHSAKHPCGIRDALFLPNLGTLGIQIGYSHSQIMGRHLKRTAGPSTSLFKNQGDVFSLQLPVGDAFAFFIL